MNPQNEGALQAIRHCVRDKKKVRDRFLDLVRAFLHSTGQAYKRGTQHRRLPADHLRQTPSIFPVPDQKYTFGVVKAAQARGDFRSTC